MIALAAAFTVFLEIKIRRAQATVTSFANLPKRATPVSPAPTPLATAASNEDGWTDRGRWKWSTDETLLRQQVKEAAAFMSYDREYLLAAANQPKVRLRFHELYRILGLNASEIALFERAAGEQGLTFGELVTSDPAQEASHHQAQARSMDRIVAGTLGPDYVEPFRAFLLTSDLRNLTADVAAHSLSAGEPLDPAQADALLQASLQLSQRREGITRINLDDVDWAAVATRAEGFLTPGQQGTLRAMIDRRQFDRTYQDITGLPLRRPVRGL